MKFSNFHKVLLLALIVLVVLNFIPTTSKKINYTNKSNKPYYSEFLCIGAGVASAYACYQIKKNGINNDKIIVLEKSDIVGGRIKSTYSNIYDQNIPEVEYAELGAMRLFDIKNMKNIFDLLKLFGLKTINISLDDGDNILYYQGKQLKKKDAKIKNGIRIEDFEKRAVDNVLKAYPNMNFDNIFDYEEFRNMNINDFFRKYGNYTDEDIKMWVAYNGYDYHLPNTQITTWLFEKNFYNLNDKDKQYYVADGMISFVNKLFENSNADIVFNTKAISVEKDSQGYNLINTINSNNVFKQYKCKYLFIGLSSLHFQQLNTFKTVPISPLRLKMASESISVPLFKVFFKWDKENIWWGKGTKYPSGKSTTDLPIRMIHYYGDEDLLIYNTGHFATELNKKFEENPAKAAIEVYEQIKRVHQMDIPPPNYNYTVYKYYPDGSHKWKIGVDVNKNVQLIPNGYIDHSNIFVVGDAFSKYQAWIIGAMDSVDIAIKALAEDISYNKNN